MRLWGWKGQVCILHLLLEGLITVLGVLALLKRDSHEAGCAEGAGTVLLLVSHPAEGVVRCPGSQGSVRCGSHHSSQSWLDFSPGQGSMCQPGWG